MAKITFTVNLKRHIDCPEQRVAGSSVAEVLDGVFCSNPKLRGYILDDQGAMRKHINIFLDGSPIADREKLTDVTKEQSEIYVMQALSGG